MNGESYVTIDMYEEHLKDTRDGFERIAALEQQVKMIEKIEKKVDNLSRYIWIAWGMGIAVVWILDHIKG